MSYSESMAAYQTKRLKRLIQIIPEIFGEYKDETDSASILDYTYNGRRFVLEPEGILNFKRGRHPRELICDDILRDPDNKMELAILDKIRDIFNDQIESMPTGALHIVGTPQDKEDLFYHLSQNGVYDVKTYPAWNTATDTVLWPETFPLEDLKRRKQMMGEKSFNKEFQCMPVRTADSFISHEKYAKIENKGLKNYGLNEGYVPSGIVCAGFDIGKKTHPSHLLVLEQIDNKLVQIHSKFMDGWDYQDQINYLNEAIEKFSIQKLEYDNTRSEFEGFEEQGQLRGEMCGEVFTSKSQFRMSTQLDVKITNGELELIADERQKRQLLSVDCDLKAPSNSDGHGDSFWSLALAIDSHQSMQGRLIWTLE
jgi:hypothetical protein